MSSDLSTAVESLDFPVDNAPVRTLVHKGLSIEGYSRAAVQTYWRVPELKLARPLYEVWDGRRPRGKAARAFHCVLEHAVRGTLPKPRGVDA